MDRIEAQRAIATLHSFRFFGLAFILPGVVGNLPEGFATFAAYGDFTTGLLAILALLTVRIRPVFWPSVMAFNLVGSADLHHRLLQRHPTRPSSLGRRVGFHLRDPDHLRPAADDYARRRILFTDASAVDGASANRGERRALIGNHDAARRVRSVWGPKRTLEQIS
jgi:hypothetical protein